MAFMDDILAAEERLARNPYSLKEWITLLSAISPSDLSKRFATFERALAHLPRSYKIWNMYLSERKLILKYIDPRKSEKFHSRTCQLFEEALAALSRMPLLYLSYADFLKESGKLTQTRRLINRALMFLPPSQHGTVWDWFTEFVRNAGVPKLTIVFSERILKIQPEKIEEISRLLSETGCIAESVRLWLELLHKNPTSKKEIWTHIRDLLSKSNEERVEITEEILRKGMIELPEEVASFWNALAESYTRIGRFEKARDVYEEALGTVKKAKDFSIIFSAYSQFEEGLVSAAEDTEEIDLHLLRLEHLLQRRPFLMNEALLRRNPHDVGEWVKRIELFNKDASSSHSSLSKVVHVYSEALQRIDPEKAENGQLSAIWLAFAEFYETNDDIDSSRMIYEKASKAYFKGLDELSTIWCAWVEFEIRHKAYSNALAILRQATTIPSRKSSSGNAEMPTSRQRLYRSTKLWAIYADIEESLGTFETAKSVYERMLDLKVATPQIVLNYVDFLRTHGFVEDSFRVYEKSISLFPYPLSLPLWSAYLKHFLDHYGSKKIERARELFESVLESIPLGSPELKQWFLDFSAFEENFGSKRLCLKVFDRACQSVQERDRFAVYKAYIAKTKELVGSIQSREIYERAMSAVSEGIELRNIGLEYAETELALGEVDRTRGIYTYLAQFCSPVADSSFWSIWNDFEVEYGNEETFREMLRMKRSIAADFEKRNFLSSESTTKIN